MADTETSELLVAMRGMVAELGALRGCMATLRADLSGKDWPTVDEAAHYCGVSRSQFDARAAEYGIEPRNFMGKKLYEKACLHRAIYDARPWARGGGQSVTSAPISPDVADAMARLARHERKKGLTMGRRK